jgi:aminomethyltransferase
MNPLLLHARHTQPAAEFTEVNGREAVAHYGDPASEYRALLQTVAVLDLGFRSRLCLIGADRKRFLHGQVTNDVQRLNPGEGCYAALITAKGKMLSDLNIYVLSEEILLDFEPGRASNVAERLEKYIIADDVQVIDVAADYAMIGLRGPQSSEVLSGALAVPISGLPARPFQSVSITPAEIGELYVMNQPGPAPIGYDLFVPGDQAQPLFDELLASARPRRRLASPRNGPDRSWPAAVRNRHG